MRRLFTWKWLTRIAIAGFFITIVLPLIYRAITRYQGQSELEVEIQRLNETDPGWTLDEVCAARNAKLPPDERNSYVMVKQAVVALPRGFDKDIQPLFDAVQRQSNTQLRPEEEASLVKFLNEHSKAVGMARKLADYPEGGRSLTYPEMPLDLDLTEIQNVRGVMSLVQFDAVAAAQANRPKDAIRSARAGLNISRSIGDEPCIISQLVRTAGAAVACKSVRRLMGLCEPKEGDGLVELQAELLADAEVARGTYALRGERASIHRMFELLDNGKFFNSPSAAAGTGLGSNTLNRAGLWIMRGYLPSDHLCSLKMMNEAIAVTKKPFDEQAAAFKQLPLPPVGDPRFIFSSLLMPAVGKSNDSALRIRGELLATAVGIACERHRQRTGYWPVNIADIPKDILPAVPNDPFTGRPINYKRLPDGIVVYAVGPDSKDDGGMVEADEKAGVRQTDYGIRLWDVTLRRAMPPDTAAPGSMDGDEGPEAAPLPRQKP